MYHQNTAFANDFEFYNYLELRFKEGTFKQKVKAYHNHQRLINGRQTYLNGHLKVVFKKDLKEVIIKMVLNDYQEAVMNGTVSPREDINKIFGRLLKHMAKVASLPHRQALDHLLTLADVDLLLYFDKIHQVESWMQIIAIQQMRKALALPPLKPDDYTFRCLG